MLLLVAFRKKGQFFSKSAKLATNFDRNVEKNYDQKAMNGVLFYFSINNLCSKQNVNKFIDPMKELASGKQYH